MATSKLWSVIDLFSGAGGMSYGFHASNRFELVQAVDAQLGKPSSGAGSLDCNRTYERNIGIEPHEINLGEIDSKDLFELCGRMNQLY